MFATTKTRRLKIAGKPHEKQFEKTSLRKFIGIPAFSNKYLYIYIFVFKFPFSGIIAGFAGFETAKNPRKRRKRPDETAKKLRAQNMEIETAKKNGNGEYLGNRR